MTVFFKLLPIMFNILNNKYQFFYKRTNVKFNHFKIKSCYDIFLNKNILNKS